MDLNEYLKNSCSWGVEQFVLQGDGSVIAYVSCQIINENMWIGWSLKPDLCGKGIGKEFVDKCINEIIELKKYNKNEVFLKVINWNKRAIRTYEKSGFKYYDKLIRTEDNKSSEYFIMKIDIN